MSTNNNVRSNDVNLSNPRVMSMKKKMMAQKKEKGMEAIASLNRINCENLISLKYNVLHVRIPLLLQILSPVNNENEALSLHPNVLNFETLGTFSLVYAANVEFLKEPCLCLLLPTNTWMLAM